MDVLMLHLSAFALIAALFAGCVFVLVIPAIIAFRRQHPNRWLILAVCLFLGGTGIGWAVALVWALRAAHRSPDAEGSHGGESGINLFANDFKHLLSEGSSDVRAGNTAKPLTVADVVQQIDQLERLKAAGHIDEIEFGSLKAAALRQMQKA